jgi:hypothetical protein
MTPMTLEGVPVDRCRVHGVWLDGGELASTLHNAGSRPPRTDGIEVDLRPFEPQYERQQAMHAWFTRTVAEVEASTRLVENRVLADAIAQLRNASRPSADLVIAFLERGVAVTERFAVSPTERYLQEAMPRYLAWGPAYAVMASKLETLQVNAGELYDFAATLAGSIPDLEELAPPDAIAAAHRSLVEAIRTQHAHLAAAIEAANARDAIRAREQLVHFVNGFGTTDDAISLLIART